MGWARPGPNLAIFLFQPTRAGVEVLGGAWLWAKMFSGAGNKGSSWPVGHPPLLGSLAPLTEMKSTQHSTFAAYEALVVKCQCSQTIFSWPLPKQLSSSNKTKSSASDTVHFQS